MCGEHQALCSASSFEPLPVIFVSSRPPTWPLHALPKLTDDDDDDDDDDDNDNDDDVDDDEDEDDDDDDDDDYDDFR